MADEDLTPRPMQVRADAMRARALGYDVADVGPTPPDTHTITIDAIPDPSTSPVTVTGTVTPGAVVNVGIMQDGTPLVATDLDAREGGAFSIPYELPVGTGYAAHVHVTAQPEHASDGNVFSVTAP